MMLRRLNYKNKMCHFLKYHIVLYNYTLSESDTFTKFTLINLILSQLFI